MFKNFLLISSWCAFTISTLCAAQESSSESAPLSNDFSPKDIKAINSQLSKNNICENIIVSNTENNSYINLPPLNFEVIEGTSNESINSAIVIKIAGRALQLVYLNKQANSLPKVFGCVIFKNTQNPQKLELEYGKTSTPITTPHDAKINTFIPSLVATSVDLINKQELVTPPISYFTKVSPDTNYASYKISLKM